MLALGISLLFNIIAWSTVFFLIRKIEPAPTNGSRHLKSKEVYRGDRTADAKTLLPVFYLLVVLMFIVFFASPNLTTWSARLSGAAFIFLLFLSYLYLLRAFAEGEKK